jgi:hypothetical protein
MEQIGNFVKIENYLQSNLCSKPRNGTTMQSDSDTGRKKLSDRAISRIWEKMSAIYGHRWVSSYGLHVDDSGNMTQAAETWRMGLEGLSREQLASGFNALLTAGMEWPPTLPEFRELCLQSGSDTPSLDQVVQVLVTVSARQGSLVDRYRHPLCLALAIELDMYALRQASNDRALAMVRPSYKRLVAQGWEGWPAHAHERQQAIAHHRTSDRQMVRQALSGLSDLLSGSAMANR